MTIQAEIKALLPSYDARHVQAYMECSGIRFSECTKREFNREARLAAQCIDEGGKEQAERLAQSFGL